MRATVIPSGEGYCRIFPLHAAEQKETAEPFPRLFRLWVVSNNQPIPHTDVGAGVLQRSLCFYPSQYAPDVSPHYMSGYAVHFDPLFVRSTRALQRFDRLLERWPHPTPTIRRREEWFQPCLKLCQVAETEPAAVPGWSHEQVGAQIVGHLTELLESTVPWLAPREHLSDTVTAFLELVEQHFHEEHAPSYYAHRLNVSDSLLRKRCREDLHNSPSSVILLRVAKEAKRLLLNTHLSRSLIAQQVGFDNPTYFGERFKEAVGISPLAFRRMHRTVEADLRGF